MIYCIFTTEFYTIVIYVDTITKIITIISYLQKNFCLMLRALYRIFQIAVTGGGWQSPTKRGEPKIFLGGYFYQLVRT